MFNNGILAKGPIDLYADWLVSRGHQVSILSHPLDDYQDHSTLFSISRKKIWERKRKAWGIVNLLFDFLLSLFVILKDESEVALGANNFDTFNLIVANKLFRKKYKKIVYFATDLSEQRYNNRLMDKIYGRIECWALSYSDLVVSNTSRAESARMKHGLDLQRSIVVPNGVTLPHAAFTPRQIDKKSAIFVGHVSNEHGLVDLLTILAPTLKKLVVIGYGKDIPHVQAICKAHQLPLDIHSGKDQSFVLDYLQGFNGWGLAPYNNKARWTYYCSPMKVSEYIASGLPVIMSNVPEVAGKVEKEGLGVVYTELDESLLQKVAAYDSNGFAVKARQFYAEYNHSHLYGRIDRQMLGISKIKEQ